MKLQAAWGWQYFATRQVARPRQSPWVLSSRSRVRGIGHENRVGARARARARELWRAKVSLFSRFALTCWLLEAEQSKHVAALVSKNTAGDVTTEKQKMSANETKFEKCS